MTTYQIEGAVITGTERGLHDPRLRCGFPGTRPGETPSGWGTDMVIGGGNPERPLIGGQKPPVEHSVGGIGGTD